MLYWGLHAVDVAQRQSTGLWNRWLRVQPPSSTPQSPPRGNPMAKVRHTTGLFLFERSHPTYDWGWIQHMFASLRPNGKMAVVRDRHPRVGARALPFALLSHIALSPQTGSLALLIAPWRIIYPAQPSSAHLSCSRLWSSDFAPILTLWYTGPVEFGIEPRGVCEPITECDSPIGAERPGARPRGVGLLFSIRQRPTRLPFCHQRSTRPTDFQQPFFHIPEDWGRCVAVPATGLPYPGVKSRVDWQGQTEKPLFTTTGFVASL